MEIEIRDNIVRFKDQEKSFKSYPINTVSYQYWDSKDVLEFRANEYTFRDNVSDIIVNEVQMTSENIDELLSPIFFLGDIDIEDIEGLQETLDKKADLVDGYVPSYQLPSYVDDVIEGKLISDTEFDVEGFIITPENGKIYVDTTTNKSYRWSGSIFVEISKSLGLGVTSSTAFRGDYGQTAYNHSEITGNPHRTTKSDVGLGNVDNTSDSNKPVSTAQQQAINTAINGIKSGGINYLKNVSFITNTSNWAAALNHTIAINTDKPSVSIKNSMAITSTGAGSATLGYVIQQLKRQQVVLGQIYTLAFWAKSSVALNLHMEFQGGAGSLNKAITTDWTFVKNTFTASMNSSNLYLWLMSAGTVLINDPQLEIGNIATDCSDIQDQLDALSARITALGG